MAVKKKRTAKKDESSPEVKQAMQLLVEWIRDNYSPKQIRRALERLNAKEKRTKRKTASRTS